MTEHDMNGTDDDVIVVAVDDDWPIALWPASGIYDPHLTDGAVRLWAVLCDPTPRGRAARRSRTSLAAALGVSRDVIGRRILELSRAGLAVERLNGIEAR